MTALFDFVAHYGPATALAAAVIGLAIAGRGLPPATTITPDRAVTPTGAHRAAEPPTRRDSPTQPTVTYRLGDHRTGCAAPTYRTGQRTPPHATNQHHG